MPPLSSASPTNVSLVPTPVESASASVSQSEHYVSYLVSSSDVDTLPDMSTEQMQERVEFFLRRCLIH